MGGVANENAGGSGCGEEKMRDEATLCNSLVVWVDRGALPERQAGRRAAAWPGLAEAEEESSGWNVG